MSTVVRASVSKSNKYYISKHRYYELKHFCLQYKEWKQTYNDMCDYGSNGILELNQDRNYFESDMRYLDRKKYLDRIDIVKKAAYETDNELWTYILKGVTENLSYTYLNSVLGMPCCKDIYYERYRKFYWTLSKLKELSE